MTTNANQGPTWYDILGVGPDARPEEIKAAWRLSTDKFEPGSGTGQFRLFNEAADVLLDPQRREAYDAELAGAGPSEPTPEVEPVQTPEVGQAAEADPSGTPRSEKPGSGPLAALGRLNSVVLAAIAVLAVGSLVLAGILGMRIQDRVRTADAGPDASASAERALTAVLSYDYRHMEADRDRAARFLTPAYRKQYLKNFDDLLTKGPDGTPGPAVKTQAVVKADVLDTGVVDAESDRVRVVVFVNQSSTKGTAEPTIFQDRVVATMVRRGESWLVDNILSY